MKDQEILCSLRCYVKGEPLTGGFTIVEYDFISNFQVEQPPDVRSFGTLGRLYCIAECSYKPQSGPPNRERQTWDMGDKTGRWKSTNGQTPIYENYQIMGYKQHFVFHRREPGREVRTAWAMDEYTLYSKEHVNKYALYELWKVEKSKAGGPPDTNLFAFEQL